MARRSSPPAGSSYELVRAGQGRRATRSTSANDAAERDPQDWTLQGSNDGNDWTTLDTQTGQSFAERFQTKQYDVANDQPRTSYYRLDITREPRRRHRPARRAAALQRRRRRRRRPPDMRSARRPAARAARYNAKPNAGFTGVRALQLRAASTPPTAAATPTTRSSTSTSPVTPDTELSYLIFPELRPTTTSSYPSTYASVDLAFTDGTYLSDLGAIDQHGVDARARRARARRRRSTPTSGTTCVSRIGDVAAGKTIDRILVALRQPRRARPTSAAGSTTSRSTAARRSSRATHLSDWVVTTRGTNSSGSFSRGNNIPATAVPHGFNFWTPVTNAGSLSWLYEYQRGNNADNLPTIQAFAASHEPSPWMGDRQTFQVMPSAASGTPDAEPQRPRAAVPARERDRASRTTTASRSRTGMQDRDRADRPRGDRSASRSRRRART